MQLALLLACAALVAPPDKPHIPGNWLRSDGPGFRFVDGLHDALRATDTREARLVVELPAIGEVELELRRFEPVTADATVELGVGKRVQSTELTAALRQVVHFEGAVSGYDGSSCYLAFGSTGAAGWVNLGESGSQFTLRRAGGSEAGLCTGPLEFVRSSGTSAPEVPTCGGAIQHSEGGTAGFGAVPPGVRKVVRLAVDSDFDYYRIFDNPTAATEYVAVLYGAGSAIYRRDCDATLRVAYLRLQDNPADLFNDPDPLGPFRDYWELNGTAVSRDLFTFLTGRRNLPYGGVAWLNAACSDFGYSVTGYINGVFADPIVTNPGNWDINVTTHEFGHNLGTYHTHDYGIDGCASGSVQRGTIMSYCHVVSGASSNIDLRFHRGTVEPIENFLAASACLASDCNDNLVNDADEIAANPARDSNGDGVLDSCQDCNGNGVLDQIDILGGAADIDNDLRPDACETDCDQDGVPDSHEFSLDPTLDSDGDMRLDSCQADCNSNGIADSVEINADMTLDRSRDGRIDSCEDCDGDGIDDFTELKGSKSRWVGSATDNLIRELDPRSGTLRAAYACGSAPVNDLAIGPDGRLYAAAGNRVYVLALGDIAASAWSVVLSAEVRALAAAPDGSLNVLLANGRIDILGAAGQIISTFVPATPVTDARDLVFRTVAGSPPHALVTFSNGVVRRFSWPAGTPSVFADISALAPGLRGAFVLDDGSVLVAASALNQIIRLDPSGANLGEWDVENGALLNAVHSICDAGDGRGVLATGTNSASTINGFNKASGYTERTYRVYPADAPAATAIVVAPASTTDLNGNLVPDSCEFSPADLNQDGVVNGTDLGVLLGSWGPCAGCAADINHDGSVGAADLAMMLSDWG